MIYQIITPQAKEHVDFVNEYQKDIRKLLRGKETLTQTWAAPFSKISFNELLDQNFIYVATTTEPRNAIIGFAVGFSRMLRGLNSHAQEIVDAVSYIIGDPHPFFVHLMVSDGDDQEDVFNALIRACIHRIHRQQYFKNVVILEQSNPYLRRHLERASSFFWENSFYITNPNHCINVFVSHHDFR